MYPYDQDHDFNRNHAQSDENLPVFTYSQENTYEQYSPEMPPLFARKKRNGRKTARYVALGAACIITASAAGGGTAWYLLHQEGIQLKSGSNVVMQTATVDKTNNAANSIAYVANLAADSVVEIDTQTRQENYFMGSPFGSSLVPGAGSGVVISEDGYIVTNYHVVQGAEQMIVRTTDGTEYPATLIGSDAQSDLAVLKVEANGLKAVTMSDSDQLQVGDLAVAIGNPLGELGGTVTSGIVSATSREIMVENGSMNLLQTSAAINPGNSGGGLFDSNGHLIGIVNAKSSGVNIEGLGFAIPSNTVQKVVRDIIENGYVSGRAEMGIQVVEITDAMTAQMYGVSKSGVYIADAGSNQGLREGDRFVFIDGVSIDAAADIASVLGKHNVGDQLNVTVERNGKAVETQVTLREQLPVNQPKPAEKNEI